MRADIEPSTTMKFLFPLALVPVTVLTSAALVATIDLPGSMMIVSPKSSTTPLIVSIRSLGVGSLSPLQAATFANLLPSKWGQPAVVNTCKVSHLR